MTDTAGRNPPVLPPGRELNALVAEMVMGWRSWDARFNPSADWEAMRLVVERLVALGWTATMRAMWDGTTCSLVNDQPGRSTVYEYGDTLPHAVALAALKAVEADRA